MASPGIPVSLLSAALQFAAVAHRDQRRRDEHASPFINHPIDTVDLLARAGVDDTVILAAAAMHDLLEETATTVADLDRHFGIEVRRLVQELTDAPGATREVRRRRQLEHVARLSPGARLIRLADKIANLQQPRTDRTAEQHRVYLDWVAAMGAALRGQNACLDSCFANALKRARASPPRPTLQRPQLPPDDGGPPIQTLVKRLQDQLARLDNATEDLADRVARLPPNVSRAPFLVHPPHSASVPTQRQQKPRRTDDRQLKSDAARGARNVAIERRAGGADVLVDDHKPFFLTPLLLDLFEIVFQHDSTSLDGWPPPQALAAVATALSVRRHHKYQPRHIITYVARIRDRMQQSHVPPLLLETLPTGGVRFRIRRCR
jgi:guanosine-3',5'-bis(diphosphate) 3'-pyrophosphohydrolase